jgi:hypothetical protein
VERSAGHYHGVLPFVDCLDAGLQPFPSVMTRPPDGHQRYTDLAFYKKAILSALLFEKYEMFGFCSFRTRGVSDARAGSRKHGVWALGSVADP